MKKILVLLSVLCCITTADVGNAQPLVITYANCTALNKVYRGGVARRGATNVGGRTRYTPFYDDALYAANKKSDRDKDGIACEK